MLSSGAVTGAVRYQCIGALVKEGRKLADRSIPFPQPTIHHNCILSYVVEILNNARPRIHAFPMVKCIMALKPHWYANIPKIRRTVTAMTNTPMFDRQAIQLLFGVKARSANNIMTRLGGYQIGGAHAVSREMLLEKLDALGGSEATTQPEAERKARVVEAIERLRRDAGPRRVQPLAVPVSKSGTSAMPSNARVSAPGEMVIRYSSPEEFLGVINAFAQSAVNDYASFADALATVSPEATGVE